MALIKFWTSGSFDIHLGVLHLRTLHKLPYLQTEAPWLQTQSCNLINQGITKQRYSKPLKCSKFHSMYVISHISFKLSFFHKSKEITSLEAAFLFHFLAVVLKQYLNTFLNGLKNILFMFYLRRKHLCPRVHIYLFLYILMTILYAWERNTKPKQDRGGSTDK